MINDDGRHHLCAHYLDPPRFFSFDSTVTTMATIAIYKLNEVSAKMCECFLPVKSLARVALGGTRTELAQMEKQYCFM